MPKVVEIASTDRPTCSDCYWFERVDTEGFGECFYNPPSASFDEEGAVQVCRPLVVLDERACSKFRSNQ